MQISVRRGKPAPRPKQEPYRESFLKGLDYLVKGEYPYNDDAMIGVMKLLRDVAAGKPNYAFVDDARRERAASAVEKGIK